MIYIPPKRLLSKSVEFNIKDIKMKVKFIILLAAIFTFNLASAQEPSLLQLLFTVKKILPETKTIAVFITEKSYNTSQEKLARAAVQSQLEVKVYKISDSKSIGKSLKKLKNVGVLLVYNDPVLAEKKNRLFILSKSKSKKIPIISSSQEYSDSGALIHLSKGADKRTQIVINLKQSEYLSGKFTDEAKEKLGIAKLIR
jgi:ribosomal protein L30E